jgi:hypothetical protein
MKKILFLLALIVTTFSLQAQNKPENSIYANYLRFKNYYSNGSYVQADIEAKKLLKGVGLMNEFLLGSFAGRSGLMDSCMTEFNALYGKTHTAPSITISSLSYLELDSISYDDGVTWFDASDIITVDSINGLIAAAGVDSTIVIALIDSLSIDSTFLNTHLATLYDTLGLTEIMEDSVLAYIADSTLLESEIVTLILNNSINRDTFDVQITNVLDTVTFLRTADIGAQIEDSLNALVIPLQDSTWETITADTIIFNLTPSAELKMIADGSYGLKIQESGLSNYAFRVTGINGINAGTPQIVFTTSSATVPTFVPNISDANTGYSWVSTDRLGVVAGGQSVATFQYAGTKKTTNLMDSLIVTGINASRGDFDSLKTANGYHTNLVSFDDTPADTAVALIKTDGTSFTALITKYGALYESSLQPDIPDNEFAFWRDDDDGKVYLIKDINGDQYALELTAQ